MSKEKIEIPREEFTWTPELIGTALIIKGGTMDSFGNPVKPELFYEVGRHKVTQQCCIVPTGRNQKEDFTNEILNKQNRFN